MAWVARGTEAALGTHTVAHSTCGAGPLTGVWEDGNQNTEGFGCQARDPNFIPKAYPQQGPRQRHGEVTVMLCKDGAGGLQREGWAVSVFPP